jgi:fumarate reductase subunit D
MWTMANSDVIGVVLALLVLVPGFVVGLFRLSLSAANLDIIGWVFVLVVVVLGIVCAGLYRLNKGVDNA